MKVTWWICCLCFVFTEDQNNGFKLTAKYTISHISVVDQQTTRCQNVLTFKKRSCLSGLTYDGSIQVCWHSAGSMINCATWKAASYHLHLKKISICIVMFPTFETQIEKKQEVSSILCCQLQIDLNTQNQHASHIWIWRKNVFIGRMKTEIESSFWFVQKKVKI